MIFEVPLEGDDVPGGSPEEEAYRLRFSLLALVRDKDGRIVERFSDNYPFEGPLDKLASLKRGNLIFKRPFTLLAGRLHRRLRRAGSRQRPHERPEVAAERHAGRRPRASAASRSCAGSKRPDRSCRPTTRSGSTACVSSRISTCRSSKAQNPNLSVYFIVYTTPGTTPKMALEFLKGDAVVARARPELPAADAERPHPLRRARSRSRPSRRAATACARWSWKAARSPSPRRPSPSFPDHVRQPQRHGEHRGRTEACWDEN